MKTSVNDYLNLQAKLTSGAASGSLQPDCSAARPMRKGKGMVLMFQSAVSGLWYYNYQTAEDQDY